MPDRFTWAFRAQNIAEMIESNGLTDFLQWPVSAEALYTMDWKFARLRLQRLQSANVWPLYSECLGRFKTGNPPHNGEVYDPHIIAQAYHFSKLELGSIDSIESIYEFGGGFGSMALLLKRMGFTGQYVIQDLPELLQIQEYFLKGESVDGVVLTDKPIPGEYSLFIANCSVEEASDNSPSECWDVVSASSYEICYNVYWEKRTTLQFLNDNLVTRNENYWWTAEVDAIYPNHAYMIGRDKWKVPL